MPERMPLLAVLAGMIDQPGRALANITTYPRWRWLLPVVLLAVALAISLALTAPLLSIQARQALAEQMAKMPASQAEMIRPNLEQIMKPEVIVGTAFGSTLGGFFVSWLLQALILYLGLLMVGGELEFKRLWAAMPWLSLPFALEQIVLAVFAFTQGRLVVNQGLSYVVSIGKPLEDARNLAYVALGQVTLFRLWHLLLAYVLLRRAAKLSAGGALVLTLVYAALTVGLQLALVALGTALSPQ